MAAAGLISRLVSTGLRTRPSAGGDVEHRRRDATDVRMEGCEAVVSKLPLSVAVGHYAITMPLVTGEVEPKGVEVTPLDLPSPERHWRMLRHQEFDVAETSIAGYLRAFEQEPDRWTAIPVFPHRRFRHGYIFVIDPDLVGHPERLNGRSVGVRTWATSAGVWQRGILQDHHEVDLSSIRWVTEHAENVVGGTADGFEIEQAPASAGLVELLASGELDALIYPEFPAAPPDSQVKIRRMFPDPKRAELDYAAAGGAFPIMHTVAMRRSVAEEHPWVPLSLMAAFEQAKRLAYRRFRDPRYSPLAWVESMLEEQDEVLGDDPWPYDFATNEPALATLQRFAHEQGLISEKVEVSSHFWPSTLLPPPAYRAAGRQWSR